MKKIAAAAVAATTTLSLVAPMAGAASNTMTADGYCQIVRDDATDLGFLSDEDPISKNFTPQEAHWQYYAEPGNPDAFVASSRWGEALGSSDGTYAYDIRYANNLRAVRACAEGKDFQSAPVAGAEKAGIIIGTVLLAIAGVAAAASPLLLPYIQKYLPF